MKSVLEQTSKNFEYIVVDGSVPQPPKGGVLKDKEVIEGFIIGKIKNDNSFIRCTWHSPLGVVGGGFYSEPDSGIYNAMNKGIRMAKGDYIHFLNSGDWLVNEHVVEKMLKQIDNQNTDSFSHHTGKLESTCDILVGNVISIRPDGKVRYKKNSTKVSLYTFYRGTIEHTSAYIRRSLFDKHGLYDESLKIVSDWKWYLIVAGLNNANIKFADTYVTFFDSTGISSTNLELDKTERRKVLEELVPAPILADYDNFHFDIDQMQRIQKYKFIYKLVYLLERILFKFEKWNIKYFSWKNLPHN
jgi:glycosyltransferase involved in cell wall biosynthesis